VDCPAATYPDGNHAVVVGVGDYSGNQSNPAATQFFVDTIAPVINPISASVPAGTDTAVVNADISDPAPGSGIDQASVQVTLDGVTQSGCLVDPTRISCNFTGLQLGDHTVGITTADIAGNSGTSSRTFQVADTVAPVITSPEPVGSVLADSPVVAALFGDDLPSSGINPAAVRFEVDGAAIAGCSITEVSLSCLLSGVADGSHQIVATVADHAGNTGNLAWSITVNGGPHVTILVPAAGDVVNNPTTPVSATWSDVVEGVDEASVHVYLDGVSMEPPGITLAAGSFRYQPGWGSKLDNGSHTARVVVADLKGAVTDHVWSFTVTSPALAGAVVRIYWESYASYLRRELTVSYRLTDIGTGPCLDATVAAGMASGGVMPAGFPVADYSFRYSVPAGVGSFMAINYASCTGGGGNTYWSPGPPPT